MYQKNIMASNSLFYSLLIGTCVALFGFSLIENIISIIINKMNMYCFCANDCKINVGSNYDC